MQFEISERTTDITSGKKSHAVCIFVNKHPNALVVTWNSFEDKSIIYTNYSAIHIERIS